MAALCTVEQRLEVLLQLLRILFRRLAIYTWRAAFADTPVSLVHPLDVDVMRQRVQ